jgi:uncharacterized protein (DUF58 family)
MTLLTVRGWSLLGVAVVTYLSARLLGTWELYLLSFAFMAALLVSWALVRTAGRKLSVTRALSPERPTAGEPLTLSFHAENHSLLPGLQVRLAGAAGDLGEAGRAVDFESLGPRATRVVTEGPLRAMRGVHRLPALVAEVEDPLGLAHTGRRLGDELEFTVYPKIAHLRSCALFPGLGERREAGRSGLAALAGLEFRGIRPHNPGEPLSHVDWKATAKTGTLMLRETEDPASGDVTLLLEGSASAIVGEPPDTNFELAIEAAGSLAAYALRSGRGVTLLLHRRDWDQIRLSADAGGRQRLLETLARAEPHAALRLGPSLRVLLAGRARVLRADSLSLVVLSLDRELAQAVIALRDEGRQVSVLHVAPDTFTAASQTPEARNLLLSLAAAGVPCLTVSRGDDLSFALSARGAEPVLLAHGRP